MKLSKDNIQAIQQLCQKAAKAILAVYATDFEVKYKEDDSPLSKADTASHQVLSTGLKELFPDIPIISEEMSEQVAYEQRKDWKRFWLVDPLDGTKEFIKKNDQFCICVALIEENKPVFGCIYEPVTSTCYWAQKGEGAYKVQSDKQEALPVNQSDEQTLVVIGSLSHNSPDFQAYADAQSEHYESIQVHQIGSAIKFCHVAEGIADVYPRFVPTMEWDTAAGHIICTEAGKSMTDLETEQEMLYNKEVLRNNFFIVE